MTNKPRYQLEQELLDTMTNLDNTLPCYCGRKFRDADSLRDHQWDWEHNTVDERQLRPDNIGDTDRWEDIRDVYPYGPDYC